MGTACTPFEEKSFYDFKDLLHKLKLMTNFDVDLTLSPRRGTNSTFHSLFITPRNEVRLTSGASFYKGPKNDLGTFS